LIGLFSQNRYFFRYFLSRFISRIGDGVHSLALLWLSYSWSKSGLIVGLVMVSFSLPGILISPFAGSFADRFKRQKIMAITDIVQSICTFLLAYLSFLGHLNLIYLIGITSIMSLAQAFFSPASLSIVPQIVKESDITRANGIIQTTTSFSIVLGPIFGMGLIAALGVSYAFLINAVSFLFSSLLLYGIKTSSLKFKAQSMGFLDSIKDGLSLIKNYPLAKKLLDKTAVINFFYSSITIVIPIIASKIYQKGADGIGWMMASFGVGMFLSSLILGSIKRDFSPKFAIAFSIFIVGLGFFGFGLVDNFYISLISLFTVGFFLNFANVSIISLLQKRLPNEVLGRIMAFLSAISLSLMPLSYALTGFLVDWIGIKLLLGLSGLFILINAFRLFTIDELR
jgi:DHA3 family macrolide efflux protein-like MFS transporter